MSDFHQGTCLQGKSRDGGVENGLVDTVGKGEGGTSWQSGTDIYASLVAQMAKNLPAM